MQVVEGIAVAQEALELLIPAGDFGGALDVLADLTAAGTPMHVAGLHAFRDLPQQLGAAEEVCVLSSTSHRNAFHTGVQTLYEFRTFPHIKVPWYRECRQSTQ
jgi:hypothetical protein